MTFAEIDSLGLVAGVGTLIATVFGSIATYFKARKQGDSIETKSLIEVNEELRRDLKSRREEVAETRKDNEHLHQEIADQRTEIDALQRRVSILRTQVEELDRDLRKASRAR